MAKVLLISTGGIGLEDYSRILRSATDDVFKVHHVTDDPESADLIIFFEPADPYLSSDVRNHPYSQRYPDKTFLFDPSDRVIPFLPGIYASIRKGQYDRARVRSGFYPVVFDHDWIDIEADRPPPQNLFSFVGRIRGNAVREAIGKLRHPRSAVRDASDDPGDLDEYRPDLLAKYHREFAEALADSKFTLCPKGAGASTLRIFETMKAGRVPVIISDEWVPPEGPAWESFSLIVREKEIGSLPEILERRENSAAEMGRLARSQWDQWFSRSASFHRIVEWCLSIRQSRKVPERTMRALVLGQLIEPFNFRHKLVPAIRQKFGPRK